MAGEREIFRPSSLERLSSPERMDRLLGVVRPQNWILLGSMGAGLVLVLLWGLYGRIPETATGTAVLVRPKQVVSIHASGSGPLEAVLVGVGDRVQAGQELARIHLPSLREELDQERARRIELEEKSTELLALRRELAEEEKTNLDAQRVLIEERMESVRDSAERARQKNDAYLAEQRANVAVARERSEELAAELRDLHARLVGLQEMELATETDVIEARRDVIDVEQALDLLEVRESELDLRENLALEAYDEQMDLVRDLEMQLSDLELRRLEIDGGLRQTEIENDSVLRTIDRRIAELEVRLENEGTIRCTRPGRVLEITAFAGQHVPVGGRIGKMEIEDPDAPLMAIAFFRVKDGKRVLPDQRIRVSPATVERERFGGIVGRVEEVSEYPVTIDAAATQIGDRDMAGALLQGETRIQVTASLAADPESFTGYSWTSGTGPDDHRITAGTTGEARVTLEERAPITLVLPFLRSLGGL